MCAFLYDDYTIRQALEKMESVGKGEVVDQLRISVINSVGNYLMPPVFRRFTEKYPHIQLAVQDMEAEMACSSIIRGSFPVQCKR